RMPVPLRNGTQAIQRRAVLNPLLRRELASILHCPNALGARQWRRLAPRPIEVQGRLELEQVVNRGVTGCASKNLPAQDLLVRLEREVWVAGEFSVGNALDAHRQLVIGRGAGLEPAKSQWHLPLALQPRLAFLGLGGDECECLERGD